MLNCKISKGVSANCDTSVGGILKIGFSNFDPANTFTSSSGCEIDTVSLADSGKVYMVDFLDGSGLAEVELQVGDSKDLKNFLHRVTLNFARLDCDLLGQYTNFSLAHLVAFVLTKNGDAYVFGADNGLAATSFNYSSGTNETDANMINAVFEGAQKNAPLKLTSWSVVSALAQ